MPNGGPNPWEVDVPRARSRAGDFLFCGMAGLIGIISTLMVGAESPIALMLVVALFLGVLGLRYYLLSDAPTVRAGTNVSEEQLQTLERLAALLNALPQPVMLLNDLGQIEMRNRAFVEMFGRQAEGVHISTIVRVPKALDALRQAKSMGEPVETEFMLVAGGQERTSLFYAAPLAAGRGEMIVMLRDRTEQKKLERMRTDFVANASHELRTPLASMAGFIETLQGHAKDDPEAQERFLEIMAAQCSRMLRLVEDLIGLSAIELNESRPISDHVDLGQLTSSVVESLQPIAQAAGSTVRHVGADGDVDIIGDRHELFRLFQNLSDNAIKYGAHKDTGTADVRVSVGRGVPPSRGEGFMRTGDSPSQIAVRAGIEEDELVFVQIIDDGEGIDPADLPRLTERFYRVNPQLSRSKGGTGLGLAIVKHILGRHRGGLQIESQLNVGSTFTVFLPPSLDDEPEETAAPTMGPKAQPAQEVPG